VTIKDITPLLFEQLQLAHSKTLSCPCSNIAVPYNVFVSNEIVYDPLCSSIFVEKKWIEALYTPNASALLVMDFRKTAYSQVSRLCLSQSVVVNEDRMYLYAERFFRESVIDEYVDGFSSTLVQVTRLLLLGL
jgi:hypothetical protein